MATVYITGGSAGLGRAIAEAFAENGYSVGIIARNEERLKMAAEEIGRGCVYELADVADFAQLEQAANNLSTKIGPPDIWVNNAMVTIFSRFSDIQPEEFARATAVTHLGSVHGLMIALKMMTPRGMGHIIQIGSALAYRSVPLQSPYCGAKAAIRGTMDSIRCELIHDKSPITLSMVQMPAINTPQFDWARRHLPQQPQPVPPMHSPAACAKAVLWSARHPAMREILVGKPTLKAIIAQKLMPAIMDRYMGKSAFEGQFERPSTTKDFDGNLFAAVAGTFKAEGHFSDRQKDVVHWIGTSALREAGLILFSFIMVAVAGLVLWNLLAS